MSLFGSSSKEPLWQDEFSIHAADERYVSRRQFTKFLVLTSFGMLVGNAWILTRSLFRRQTILPEKQICNANQVPVGGVRLFRYPTDKDPCILIRPDEQTYVAYSQKCTHLSCAVYYAREKNRLECPCHEGYFSVRNGDVLQGPPPPAFAPDYPRAARGCSFRRRCRDWKGDLTYARATSPQS